MTPEMYISIALAGGVSARARLERRRAEALSITAKPPTFATSYAWGRAAAVPFVVAGLSRRLDAAEQQVVQLFADWTVNREVGDALDRKLVEYRAVCEAC